MDRITRPDDKSFFSGFNYFKDCITKQYVGFGGRASREEYWYFVLYHSMIPLTLLSVVGFIANLDVLALLGSAVGFIIAFTLYYLITFLPALSVAIRRIHDTGKSGWWIFISLVPFIGSILLLIILAQYSQPFTNKWGKPTENKTDDVLNQLNTEF